MDLETWRARLITRRHEKDVAFRNADWSPVPYEDRTTFEGLSYYEPDPRYRFVAILNEEQPEETEMPISTGGTRTQRRIGTFALVLPTGDARLAAFATAGEPGALFIPFTDGTSGDGTYESGRYLEATRRRDGRYVVDLNRAYHPYCAYDPQYACPLPPNENRLQIPIPVGERLPQAETRSAAVATSRTPLVH